MYLEPICCSMSSSNHFFRMSNLLLKLIYKHSKRCAIDGSPSMRNWKLEIASQILIWVSLRHCGIFTAIIYHKFPNTFRTSRIQVTWSVGNIVGGKNSLSNFNFILKNYLTLYYIRIIISRNSAKDSNHLYRKWDIGASKNWNSPKDTVSVESRTSPILKQSITS